VEEKVLSAAPLFFAATEKTPNTFVRSFDFEDAVDGAILRRAVDKTMERYLYFAVQTAVEDGWYVLRPNPAPVPVYESAASRPLGGEANNGHLLAFRYHENTVYFEFFHGLGDGSGTTPLLQTLLYYYCREKYDDTLSPEGIRLAGDPIPEEEILDPYPDSVSEDIQPCGRYVIREAVRLFKGDRTGLFIAYVKVPEKEFMDFAKPRDGSPATMMSLLMARAVREELGQTELPIICAMAMDIRPVLKKLLAHHSVVSQLFLEYGEKMASLPLETQATAFRGMVLLQSQPENVLTSVRNNLRFVENLRQMDSLDARRRFMQGIVERSMTMSSFKFSYPGRLDLGVAEKYIKNQLIYPDITGAGLMLEVAAHGGFFHISFLQEYEDERYYRAFLRQLDAMRLPYEAGKFVPYAVPGVEL